MFVKHISLEKKVWGEQVYKGMMFIGSLLFFFKMHLE